MNAGDFTNGLTDVLIISSLSTITRLPFGIINDAVNELTEIVTATLTLESDFRGVTVDENNGIATLTIEDNDGKHISIE